MTEIETMEYALEFDGSAFCFGNDSSQKELRTVYLETEVYCKALDRMVQARGTWSYQCSNK
jgi:hypothetical protein